jgi:hypothetical protein
MIMKLKEEARTHGGCRAGGKKKEWKEMGQWIITC